MEELIKMKKRIFASLLAVIMIIGVAALVPVTAADSAKTVIAASDVTVPHGSTEAQVVVSISNVPASGIASTSFKVKVEGATITDGVPSADLRNDDPNGKSDSFKGFVQVGPTAKSDTDGVSFMSVDIGDGIKSDCELVTFKVKLPDKTACGTTFAVKVIFTDPEDNFIASDKKTSVPVEAKDGSVFVAHTLAHSEAVAATAEKDGSKEYWKCSVCNKFFSDPEGQNEINEADLVVKYDDSGDDFIPGDVNGDGNLNAKDVTSIMKFLVGKTPKEFNEAAADFNGDGKTNAKDVTGLMKFLVKGA